MKHIAAEDILRLLPVRNNYTHKGNYGKVLLLCGSKGYTGAAYFSAMGALRSGSGVVYLGVPESIYEIEAVKLSEPVVFSLADKNGKISSDAISIISEYLSKMDAVLIGPGLGFSEDVFRVTEYVLSHFAGPVIIDADGINVISGHTDILRDRTAPTILTPHDGEFRRLGGILYDDRQKSASDLATKLNAIVLLKGYRTVITDGIECYVNLTGNPGMAKGGSGDVLAGIIVSLLGQGLSPIDAAACGAYLHGAAGDICAEEIGQYGMLPQDMVNVLPRLLP